MNKKFLSVIVGIALFSSSALAAEESGFFIGADAAYVQTKVKGDLNIIKPVLFLMVIYLVAFLF